MQAAITIIKDEHRALASVMSGLLHLVAQVRAGQPPDFALMRSLLHYIEAFPDKLHHPKEDDYLYRILRARDPGAAAVLDELQDEHQRGPDTMRALVQALQAYEQSPSAFEAFAQAVSRYAEAQWAHMRKEEEQVLPLAEKALLPADWAEIDAAFKSHADPLVGVGTQREFRDLFRQVVNLMPAPLGLGPARQ